MSQSFYEASAADWVLCSCSTSGDGPLILGAALEGYATFQEAFKTETKVWYSLIAENNEREAGIGIYKPDVNVLVRDEVWSTLRAGGKYSIRGSNPIAPIYLNGSTMVACTMNASLIQMMRDRTNALTALFDGGSMGQVLTKVSDTDYDFVWSTIQFPAVSQYFLGPHSTPPVTDVIGAMYYDTTHGRTYVFDGTSWKAIESVSPAVKSSLTYEATSGQDDFNITHPDIYGNTASFSQGNILEGVDVHSKGLRLVFDDGTGNGDYTVDRANNLIHLNSPADLNDIIQIDVLTPRELLAPGGVSTHMCLDLDTDWSVPGHPTGLIDGVRTQFALYYNDAIDGIKEISTSGSAEVAVFYNGVRQQPTIDYTVTGNDLALQFAPVATDVIWALWYKPEGGSTGVIDGGFY